MMYFDQLRKEDNHTLGWDVVVNYGVNEINKALAAAHADSDSRNSITHITFQVTGSDWKGDEYNVDYNFSLGAPIIQVTFKDTVGFICELTVPVISGIATGHNGEDKAEQTVGSDVYTFVIDGLLMGTALGGSTGAITPPDTPFIFPTDSKDGIVTIDFPTSKDMSVSIQDGRRADKKTRISFVEAHKADVCLAIAQQLRTTYKNVRLELARVNSSAAPGDAVQLQPRSFMFAVLSEKNKTVLKENILSVFIQTGSTESGTRDESRGRKWSALWLDTLRISPIYSSHTASMFFKKETIYDLMIRPAIRKHGMSSSLRSSRGTISLDLYTGQSMHRDAYVYPDPEPDRFRNYRKVSQINADPDPIALVLKTEGDAVKCRGTCTYSYKFDWMQEFGYTGDEVLSYGTVTVTNTLDKTLGTTTFVDDYALNMGCTISAGDWTRKLVPDNQDFWHKFTGGSEDIPFWVSKLDLVLDTIKMDFGSLYFFLTTNLLMPGKKVIQIDKSLGLQVVGSLYIAGDVIAS